MATRLYSFRFPWDIRNSLDSWRSRLSSAVSGSGDFDTALAKLSDRDRALEDHLNFGIAQGYLDSAVVTTAQTGIPNSETALTGLTVTVTVPANRRLKITAHVALKADSAGPTGGILVVKEDATPIAERASINTLTAGSSFDLLDLVHFRAPAAGTHTYALFLTSYVGGNVKTEATASHQLFVAVEDIGPVSA
jgi:hypothetical protein